MKLKRVYESASPDDGVRVLIDRLWPRGLKKDEVALDFWLKDVTPSSELRKSWHADPQGHDPAHFRAFGEAYREELTRPPGSEALDQLVELASTNETVTLLYGAKDEQINHAVVLRDEVLARLKA